MNPRSRLVQPFHKIDFKQKLIRRQREEHKRVIKENIHQEDGENLNIDFPNTRAPKLREQLRKKLKTF